MNEDSRCNQWKVAKCTKIKIGQINLQNSKHVTEESRHLMVHHDLDVLLVQEPYSINGKIRGFGLGSSNLTLGDQKDGTRPMAGVVVKPGVEPVLMTQLCGTHITCAQIQTTEGPIYVVSLYCQFADPVQKYLEMLQDTLDKLRGKEVIIGSDINANSSTWHSRRTDEKGEEVEDFVLRNGLMVLNKPGPPTHKAGNTIDITLCTPGIYRKVQDWRVHEGESSSDHELISFIVDASFRSDDCPSGLNIRKADFEKLNLELERRRGRIEAQHTVNAAAVTLTKSLQEACDTAVPKIRKRRKVVPWWNQELTVLRREKMKRYKEWQRSEEGPYKQVKLRRFREARNLFNFKKNSAKKVSWEEFVARETNNNPFALPYKLAAEKLKIKEVFQTVEKQGTYTTNAKDTMEAILEQLVPGDNDPETEVHAEIRRTVERSYEAEEETEFTIEELKSAINRAKKRRAPGPDGIPAEVFQNLNDPNLEILLKIYNDCWKEGSFPELWKRAKARIIRKAGDRDPSRTSSYRPISLLPVIGKIYERMVADRLVQFIEVNEKLSEAQYGFRKGKSTEMAIDRLIHITTQSTEKYTAALFVDIKGAFDNLWWPEVLRRLREIEVTKNVYLFIKSYLSQRDIQLSHGGDTVTRALEKGCPQGSIMGPLLWNLVFDSLLDSPEWEEGIERIAFADDLAIIVHGRSRLAIQEKLNNVVGTLTRWSIKTKLSISKDKTKAMFLKGNLDIRRPPTVKIEGKQIKFVETFKYLGVLLDTKRTFLPHVREVASKASNLMGKIYRLAKIKYGVRPEVLKTLYKVVYLPVVSYASGVWQHRVKNYSIKKVLRTSQRRTLLNMTGGYRTTSFLALTVATGLPPIEEEILRRGKIQAVRKGRLQSSVQEIHQELMRTWQEEWSTAEVGRYTHNLFPDIKERLDAVHIDIDHHIIQLITGHGANAVYLNKHGKMETSRCRECGEEDTAIHAVLECVHWERGSLEMVAGRENVNLEDLRRLLLNPNTYKELTKTSKDIITKRNL